jgi:uncharacterized protein GlcG (DUF336 family)
MHITLKHAEELVNRAQERAHEIGVAMNIVVLDGAGHLKTFVRMDGALLGSIDVAMGKARTSALFEMNSESVWQFCKPGGGSPSLEHTNGGLVPFAGGVPIKDFEGHVIGALGVSGGSVAQDADVVRAAVELNAVTHSLTI